MAENADGSAPSLLLVEDNQGDIALFQEAMREAGGPVAVRLARRVDDAIAMLGDGRPGSDPPGLIVIDLHLPGKDGKVLLDHLRQGPDLVRIPTVILTSSTWQRDIEDCARLGALHYRVKPYDWSGYLELIRFLRPLCA
jgi:CheY-like chemotaxis protein